MSRLALGALLAAFAFSAYLPGKCQEKPGGETPAYKDARQHKRGYFGPGREEPEPEGLTEVLIGYFGPDDPKHPAGGTTWLGTTMAIEEANAEGGYKGLPFRLKQSWSENPWTSGVSGVVRMAYLDRVWAILGSIDGATTHLAEQVVAKARLTQIDPASTDNSVNMANVPWIFSCVPPDSELTAVIGRDLLEGGHGPFAILSATDHDSRALTTEFKAFLAGKKAVPKQHIEFPSNVRQAAASAAQVASSGVEAVVVLADASDSARMVRELRRQKPSLTIFGGPSIGRREFLEEAGDAAEGVRFPLLTVDSESSRRFAERFASRYGSAPDSAASFAYDAACLLIEAIRKAGLNRVRIRDAVEELSPWQGVSGVIRWDAVGRNSRNVRLGTIRGGQRVTAP